MTTPPQRGDAALVRPARPTRALLDPQVARELGVVAAHASVIALMAVTKSGAEMADPVIYQARLRVWSKAPLVCSLACLALWNRRSAARSR